MTCVDRNVRSNVGDEATLLMSGNSRRMIRACVISVSQSFRDAEMTIKIIFERSSQKGGRQGGSKRGSTGDPS